MKRQTWSATRCLHCVVVAAFAVLSASSGRVQAGSGCTNDSECNDHNPCTNDTCSNNSCAHTNLPVGTPCGGSIDDPCTDPDTCDAIGNCLQNNTPNGSDCSGPDCLGGECGAMTYRAMILPKGSSIGSEPRAGFMDVVPEPDEFHIVGRVIDGGSIDHAAAWLCNTSGSNCTLALLPEGQAGTSVANAVGCNETGTCLAVGSKGSPPQPAAWVRIGEVWNEESVPLPPTHVQGEIIGRELDFPKRTAVGSSTDSQGFRRAAYWERDSQGTWSVFLLPDFGVPGRNSASSGIVVCYADAPPAQCVVGARLIAGFAEENLGEKRPVIWKEDGAGTGAFTLEVLPLPQGALRLGADFLGLGAIEADGTADGIAVGGTLMLSDNTTRGVVWRTRDYQTWTFSVLPPLTGFSNSTSVGTSKLGGFDQWGAIGVSYPTGGDPMTDGLATRWTLDPTTLALTYGPTDVNTLVSGLHSDCTVLADVPPWCDKFGLDKSWCNEKRRKGQNPGLLGIRCSANMNVAGIPQIHAGLATPFGPAGIPALSTWGLGVMTLLMLIAGTIVAGRLIRRPQASAIQRLV